MQVVLALVLTPEGYPIGYEVLPGNTADNTTLNEIRKKIEEQYGPVERIWLMDRGIPTEESLAACGPASRRCVIWWARPRAG